MSVMSELVVGVWICATVSLLVCPCLQADNLKPFARNKSHKDPSVGILEQRVLGERRLSRSLARSRAHLLKSRWQRSTGRHKLQSRPQELVREKMKRSPVSAILPEEYHGFHIDVTTCGKEKSCIRFGPPDCVHRQCFYILTFRRIGDLTEIELSAETIGWVAVGFSSDRKMGGDEVIACIHSIVPSKVRAATMANGIPHEKPRPKDIPLNLTSAEYKDGFTSCRIRRELSVNGGIDLTNDWYQLYAWGPVGSNGGMMRHDWETPPTSYQTNSVIQRNINIIREETSAGFTLQINALLLTVLVFAISVI